MYFFQGKDVFQYPSSYSIITKKLIFINVDINNWKYIVFIEYETKVENVNLRSNFFATGKNKIYLDFSLLNRMTYIHNIDI